MNKNLDLDYQIKLFRSIIEDKNAINEQIGERIQREIIDTFYPKQPLKRGPKINQGRHLAVLIAFECFKDELNLSNEELSEALGFSEASAFSNAKKRASNHCSDWSLNHVIGVPPQSVIRVTVSDDNSLPTSVMYSKYYTINQCLKKTEEEFHDGVKTQIFTFKGWNYHFPDQVAQYGTRTFEVQSKSKTSFKEEIITN